MQLCALRSFISVEVPQLRGIPPFGDNAPRVLFYKSGAEQLRAAFAEIEAAGLLAEVRQWCGSYRLTRSGTCIRWIRRIRTMMHLANDRGNGRVEGHERGVGRVDKVGLRGVHRSGGHLLTPYALIVAICDPVNFCGAIELGEVGSSRSQWKRSCR